MISPDHPRAKPIIFKARHAPRPRKCLYLFDDTAHLTITESTYGSHKELRAEVECVWLSTFTTHATWVDRVSGGERVQAAMEQVVAEIKKGPRSYLRPMMDKARIPEDEFDFKPRLNKTTKELAERRRGCVRRTEGVHPMCCWMESMVFLSNIFWFVLFDFWWVDNYRR